MGWDSHAPLVRSQAKGLTWSNRSTHSGGTTVSMTRYENSDANGTCSAYNARPQADFVRVAASLPTAKNATFRRITPANRLDLHEVAQNLLRGFLLSPRHA